MIKSQYVSFFTPRPRQVGWHEELERLLLAEANPGRYCHSD
jgi:hypothetical protein